MEQTINAPALKIKRSNPNYSKEYYRSRKAMNPDYYSLNSRRKYYHKRLELIGDSNPERKANILSKLSEIDTKIKEIKESRGKYNHWQK